MPVTIKNRWTMKTLTMPQRRKLLKLAEAHQAADEFIQGDSAHCSVGCSVSDAMKLKIVPEGDPYSHATIAELWNVPLEVARLFDAIFEGLPKQEAMAWTPRWQRVLLENPKADHAMVWPKFALWLQTDSGLLTITDGNRKAIADVADLYRRKVAGEAVSAEAFRKAALAADAAAHAAYAAAHAAYSLAAHAAYSLAAYAAAHAAARAADAAAHAAYAAAHAAYSLAAYAAARAAARAAYAAADAAAHAAYSLAAHALSWCKMADKLCELLSEGTTP